MKKLGVAYHSETNRRPIYAGKKTEGFKKWLQQREQEKTKKVKKIKEVNEEWEKLLKKWINEADEGDISKEQKKKLYQIIDKYRKLRRIYSLLSILLKKFRDENITQVEIRILLKLAIQVEKISPVEKEFFENLYTFALVYEKNIILYPRQIDEHREKFIRHLAQKLEKLDKEDDTHERKEEWGEVLLNHIQTILDEEISQDIKEELTYIIKNYDKLQKTSKNLPPNLKQIIEELEQFQATYNVYKDRGYEKSIPPLASKVAKKLRKLFELFKNKAILKAFLNEENENAALYEKITSVNNWRELLKANLYKISMLTLKEKSQIIDLIKKEKFSKDDKESLISLFCKLKNEELIVLFGKTFEDYAKNYIHFKIFINDHSDVSSTHNFLETLKISISLLLPPHMLGQREYIWNSKTFKLIKREDLSLILGQKFYHIKDILIDARKDPLYLLSMEFLASYEKNLRENLHKLNIPKNIIDLLIFKTINTYISIHNPPSSNRYKSLKFHPNLIENYFEHIDNIEKAYWLGLLWADGWISKINIRNDDKYNLAIGLKQGLKNKHIIHDYCKAIGFNLDYLSKNVDKRYETVIFAAIFNNDRFAKHLIKKGFIVGSQKSLGIELPKLKSTPFISERDLYLGFLLGLYDGDGSTGRTCITSGNFNFLIQIKEYFQISNKISQDTYLKLDGTVGTKYRLELGRDLMAKMLINYKYSFKDKRRAIGPKLYTTYDHIVENIEGQLSREKFKSFVWNLGLTFCFSHSLICKKCMKFNIEQPSEEQWLNLSN